MFERPLPHAEWIGLDIETTGLDWHHDDILLIVLSDGQEDFIIRAPEVFTRWSRWGYFKDKLGAWLREQVFDRTVVVHNASFDLVFLDAHFGCGFPERVWDTMVCEQMLTAGLPRDDGSFRGSDETARIPLAELAQKYLGLTLDKELQTSFVGHEGELSEEQVAYARRDAQVLVPIAQRQQAEVRRHELEQVWEIEQLVTPVFCSMERHGVVLDPNILRPIIEEAEREMHVIGERLEESLTYHVQQLRIAKRDAEQDRLDAWLEALAMETECLMNDWDDIMSRCDEAELPAEWIENKWHDRTIDKKDGQPKGRKRFVRAKLKEWRQRNPRPPKPAELVDKPIDLNSAQQVQYALSSLLGVEVPNAKATTLQQLLRQVRGKNAEAEKVLSDLLEYRKRAKLVQAFGEPLIARICPEGRIHADFAQYGTATGRPTARRPNLLQIPADKKGDAPEKQLRRAFRAGPGNVMIVADYSQMELRLIAEMSGDTAMIETFRSGRDIHLATAQDVLGREEVSDDERKVAKTANFLPLYGGEAGKLQESLAEEGIYMSLEQCKAFLESWRRTYRSAWRRIQRWQQEGIRNGFTTTALGRKRFFVPAEGEYLGRLQRQASNFPIQGSNADITKLAMIVIQRALEPYGGRIVLQVYDEIVVEIPREHALRGAEIVKAAMEEAARTVLKRVPAVVDCVISASWSESDVVEMEVAQAA